MLLEFKIKSDRFFPLLADNLFSGLPLESRKTLDRLKKTKRFGKGASFYARGDAPCCVYLLREGVARLLLDSESEDIQITRLISPGEIFGLTEIIVNQPYEMRAETITPCVCECIAREDFIHYLHEEPEVCFRLAQMLGANTHKNRRLFFYSINYPIN